MVSSLSLQCVHIGESHSDILCKYVFRRMFPECNCIIRLNCALAMIHLYVFKGSKGSILDMLHIMEMSSSPFATACEMPSCMLASRLRYWQGGWRWRILVATVPPGSTCPQPLPLPPHLPVHFPPHQYVPLPKLLTLQNLGQWHAAICLRYEAEGS